MRILIVEDDAALGLFLSRGLTLEGHDVEVAGDGMAGLESVMRQAPHLLVLDLSLPRKDGIEVLEELGGRLSQTSVLVLTGRNGVEERVRCLNLGADDCMLKPFSLSELMAKCRAMMRRRQQFADPMLRFGDVELNRLTRSVARNGRSVELTAKEFALLEYLMQARGRVCLRSELLREVWQGAPTAGTNVVDVYVNYLRKKLSLAVGKATQERLIETVRGEGYAMCDDAGRGLPLAMMAPRTPTWISPAVNHA